MKVDSQLLDQILWRHLSSLPYFRAFLRAVEDSFYQELTLERPIFDLGSGDGHFASVAFDQPLDVGLDPWLALMQEARSRSAYCLLVLGEGGQIPFEDASFNTVTSTSVLEHIPDLEPVLAEVARILKPGGKFVFCVPNHRFPEELWGRKFFEGFGLRRMGEAYSRLFNRIARHAHMDSPVVWQARLVNAGFELEKTWDYFPPKALHILEWGHLLGLPALISKKVFGRWILFPNRFTLAFPWALTRSYMNEPRSEQGVCSFFVARRIP